MDNKQVVNINELCINAIDTLINESRESSTETYDYLYKLVYGKYHGLKGFADKIESIVAKKMNSDQFRFNEDFLQSSSFTKEEKQEFVTYWVACLFNNKYEKFSKRNIDFSSITDNHSRKILDILSSKNVTYKGRVYNGSEIFSLGDENSETKELNEFWQALLSVAVPTAIYMICGAYQEEIAESVPTVCKWARHFTEEHPRLSAAINAISPIDLDVLAEQDMINNGEIDPDEDEYDGNDEESEVEYEDEDEAVASQGGPSIEKYMKEHGLVYVQEDEYTHGKEFDSEGKFIGQGTPY